MSKTRPSAKPCRKCGYPFAGTQCPICKTPTRPKPPGRIPPTRC